MTTWQLIRTMLQKGYQFEIGPHCGNYRGYWACFLPSGERVISNRRAGWVKAGHAMTPHRAVVMAAKIALENKVTVPPSEEFLRV